jgi:2-amino-4-hydroxy-6-hydroxymethyldihydropteridine diphosphokinase
MSPNTLFLLIGGNQGDRETLLRQATDLIQQRIGSVAGLSEIYQTAPWGTFDADEEPQDFLNQALKISTRLSPSECLSEALAIEKELGRKRKAKDTPLYTSRPIDIDLIFYDSLIIHSPNLTLPHPRMHLRRFVLTPLCDIAPDYIHPIFNKNLSHLLSECPDTSSCFPYC